MTLLRFALDSIKPTFKGDDNEHYFKKNVSKLARLFQVV